MSLINEKPTDPVEQYAWLKREIGKLEAELDAIKDSVLATVVENGGETKGENFVIKTSKRAKYKFSDDYEKKNTELKDLRKSEIETGAATLEGYSEYMSIRFKD